VLERSIQLGLRQLRVRHHGQIARLEVPPADFDTVLAAREQLVAQLKALGYTYVTLDLAGPSDDMRAGLQ
jgi:uncharacterized protein